MGTMGCVDHPSDVPDSHLFHGEGVLLNLPVISVKEGESFESALRRFKKKCEKAGILADVRKHQHFEKPSEKRKRKENAARRKAQTSRSGS